MSLAIKSSKPIGEPRCSKSDAGSYSNGQHSAPPRQRGREGNVTALRSPVTA